MEEKQYIDYDDFKKVEIKVGEIIEAEEIPGSDKLFKLKVNFGPPNQSSEEHGSGHKQILSGIKNYFDGPEELVGKKVPFVTNLAPRKMMGLESEGMILAVIDEDNNFSLPEISSKIKNGTSLS